MIPDICVWIIIILIIVTPLYMVHIMDEELKKIQNGEYDND